MVERACNHTPVRPSYPRGGPYGLGRAAGSQREMTTGELALPSGPLQHVPAPALSRCRDTAAGSV
ncbi:hypothetical protein GCM10029978_118770 [Actinoallomurus acanthiterrae]